MTAKRDLKRRVRERQAKTGESYVTARRHVVAQAPATQTTEARPVMDVVELLDVSDDAGKLGLRCPVRMSPKLAEHAGQAGVLARLRDVLVSTMGDPAMSLLHEIALRGPAVRRSRRRRNFEDVRQFYQRARAGLGGVTDDGTLLSFPVAGGDGLVSVLCKVWDRSLVLITLDEETLPAGARFAAEALADATRRTLFLIFDGKRHALTGTEHVIGRSPSCDLQIRDGVISRKHAAVIRRIDTYYIKDLGSTAGIVYRGLRIDNKRIDEGDVFHLGEYELRFTFSATD
jgi:hypothetical protein